MKLLINNWIDSVNSSRNTTCNCQRKDKKLKSSNSATSCIRTRWKASGLIRDDTLFLRCLSRHLPIRSIFLENRLTSIVSSSEKKDVATKVHLPSSYSLDPFFPPKTFRKLLNYKTTQSNFRICLWCPCRKETWFQIVLFAEKLRKKS